MLIRGQRRIWTLPTLFGALAFGVLPETASAASTCSFVSVGTTITLAADCSTDQTLFIPEGYTLDGAGHVITALDPPGGYFLGAVLQNAGAVGHVRSVVVRASSLSPVCQSGDARLKGIALSRASGSIQNSRVEDMARVGSQCEEGNAIDVSNPPYDGSHPAPVSVLISGNTVAGFQKTGIAVNGDVVATLSSNQVGAASDLSGVVSNGVQLGYGASGELTGNVLSGNQWEVLSDPQLFATAVLVYEASGATLTANVLEGFGTDVGAAIFRSSDVRIRQTEFTRTPPGEEGIDEYGVGLWLDENSGSLRLGKNTFEGWNQAVQLNRPGDLSSVQGQASRFVPW